MTLRAKHFDRCYMCRGDIQVGDPIKWQPGLACHYTCYARRYPHRVKVMYDPNYSSYNPEDEKKRYLEGK